MKPAPNAETAAVVGSRRANSSHFRMHSLTGSNAFWGFAGFSIVPAESRSNRGVRVRFRDIFLGYAVVLRPATGSPTSFFADNCQN